MDKFTDYAGREWESDERIIGNVDPLDPFEDERFEFYRALRESAWWVSNHYWYENPEWGLDHLKDIEAEVASMREVLEELERYYEDG